MLGTVTYEMDEKKRKSRDFSRSLFIIEDVKKGGVITKENVRSIRPGYGMHPKYYNEILGKTFNGDFKKGTPMASNLIE
jgi:pseudaminic acid synthase